jgi:hypothetical protein
MEKVVEKLNNINQTLEKMLSVMQKPKNKFIQMLEIFGLGVTALSVLYFVDLIRRWIIGG